MTARSSEHRRLMTAATAAVIGALTLTFWGTPADASGAAPSADAGGPYVIAEGDTLPLSAALSSDPETDPLTYAWDLDNDGQYDDATGESPVIAWDLLADLGVDDNGVFTVAVQADDGTSTATDTASLTIANTGPTVNLVGSAAAVAGEPYELSVQVDEPGDDSIASWVIAWGDGTVDTGSGAPGVRTHTYAVAGLSHGITVEITDEDGTWSSADLVVAHYDSTDKVSRYDMSSGAKISDLATAGGGLNAPYDVTLGPDGLIYATGNLSDTVVRYDPTDNSFVGTFVSAGSGGLAAPKGLAFGPDGNLYVVDSFNGRVLRYDGTTGAFIDAFVGTGTLGSPTDVLFAPDGSMLVSDSTGDNVERYDATTGASLGVFAAAAPGDRPVGLAWGNGNLYVAMFNDSTVKEYDGATGALIGTFVSSGVSGPHSLLFGPDGELWVSDYLTEQVKRFDGSTGAALGARITESTPAGPFGVGVVPDKQIRVSAGFEVNSTGNGSDASIGDGLCHTGGFNAAAQPECTLRAAIEEANAFSDVDIVTFDIPIADSGHSSGVWTISTSGSPYPWVSETLTIDGTSHPSYSSNPVIVLDGSALGGSDVGLGFATSAHDSLVRGLSIVNYPNDGISSGVDRIRITDNLVGVLPSGTVSPGNGSENVALWSGTDARVENNVIGGASNANVAMTGATTGAVIRANTIGTDAGGTLNFGGAQSIWTDAAGPNTVGGPDPGDGNVLANSTWMNIQLPSGTVELAIVGNNTYGGGSLGIDLNEDGVTANDALDADSGANDLLNWPVPTTATETAGTIEVGFDLDVAGGTYRIDVFANPSGLDASGNGEGEQFLGHGLVAHPGGGASSLVVSVPGSAGDVLTLTATEVTGAGTYGATSEFSTSVTAVSNVGPPIAVAGGPYNMTEGDGIVLDGSGSIDPQLDPLTYQWDLNDDGTYGDVTGATPTVTWSTLQAWGIDDDGTHSIGLRVTDGADSDTDSTSILMVNAEPVISVAGSSTAGPGLPYSITISATDPGADTITGYRIHWGDGTVETVPGSLPAADSHTYAVAGVRNIVVEVTDEDGEWTTADLVVPGFDASADLERFEAETGTAAADLGSGSPVNGAASVAFGTDGLAYVVGYSSRTVERYSLDTNTHVDTFVGPIAGLNGPNALVFKTDGNLLISDWADGDIMEFHGASGASLGTFVAAGTGGLVAPSGMAIGPDGLLYVSDFTGNAVRRYDADTGAYVDTFVSAGSGGLSSPEAVTWTRLGDLLVASSATNSVKRYDPSTGAYLGDFVSAGAGGLNYPSGLLLAPDGDVLVGSRLSDEVKRYHSSTGAYIGDAAVAGSTDGPMYSEWIPDLTVNVLERFLPEAVDDVATTSRDVAVETDVTANDIDQQGDAITVVEVTAPTNGTATITAPGSVQYQPDPGYTGADGYDYLIIDAGTPLSHHWGLDGDAVDAVGSADGTVSGATAVAGVFGDALSFDEVNDHVAVPDTAYTSDWTLRFDFKIDDNSGSLFQYIYSHGDINGTNSINVFLLEAGHGSDPNELRTVIRDNNDTLDNFALATNIAALIGDGLWHSYTAVVSSTAGITVFIDGVQVAADATRGTDAIDPSGTRYFGTRQDLDADRRYGGALDSVRLFDDALTAAEIGDLENEIDRASVAVTVTPPQYFDVFGTIGLDGSDGTDDWSTTPWTEVGEADGVASGRAQIVASGSCPAGNCIRIGGDEVSLTGRGWSRPVDLSVATTAELALDVVRTGSGGALLVEVSANGTDWTTLGTITGTTSPSYDISAYASGLTAIRVVGSGTPDDAVAYHVDNVAVTYSLPALHIVNSTGDGSDATPGDDVCDTGGTNSEGDPECTLRAAIEEANASAGTATIEFAIPGGDSGHSGGVWSIGGGSQLPTITGPVDLDATTQPGFAGTPIIELDGGGIIANGLNVDGGSSTIRGLVIHSFTNEGIDVDVADGNTIAGNWIGLRADGTTVAGNGDDGIAIRAASDGNTIGGPTAADRNVLSGNGGEGLLLWNGTSGNVVEGNYLGTDATGLLDRGNGDEGLDINGAGNTVVRDNVISGNNGDGVQVLSGDGSVFTGNLIGVGADGTTPVGNTGDGITVNFGVTVGVRIGGTGAGEGNTIAHNGDEGVSIFDSSTDDVHVLANSIHSNTALGIDLLGDGVTANDAGDADSGPNDLLNFPVITSAIDAAGTVTVDFDLDVPAGDYRIEAFTNPSGADASGNGEGETFEVGTTITHTGSGSESFQVVYTGAVGDSVALTATEDLGGGSYGSTSEFSATATTTPASTVMVNSTGDDGDASPGDGTCDSGGKNSAGDPACTLRAAIQEANTSATVDIIEFAMPSTEAGHAGGVWTISPASELPPITAALTLNASTQTGWTSTPVVELEGSSAGAGSDGFRIFSADVEIRGFAINRFLGDGIEVDTTSTGGVVIAGNHIGLDTSGLVDRGNDGRGVDLQSGSGPSTIGGATTADRNVISGNGSNGVIIWSSDANVILNNFIGTDVTGNASAAGVGNSGDGIYIGGTSGGTIVGQPGNGNVLSGNGNDGFETNATGADTIVQANMIGVGADGSTALGNGRHGVVIYNGANDVQIGGSGPLEGNVISANADAGIVLDGAGNPATTSNVIAGNGIGVDATGALDRGNGSHGIEIFAGANSTVIGGPTAAHGNVISGNGSGSHAGVSISGADSDSTVIQHNVIGTNAAATAAIMNNLHGITISNAPDTDVLDNLISGNNVHGLYVFGSSTTGTEILRNTIGTNAGETAALPNGFDGIRLEGASTGTVIGSPGNGNTIAGNGQRGITINDNDANTVQGNWIGTDSTTGTLDLGNTLTGVYTDAFGSSSNLIGGAGVGEGNTIAFNGDGITFASGTGNSILGNAVSSNAGLGIDLSGGTENADGVTANDAGDADSGPNDLLNFPVITSAIDAAGTVTVDFDLDVPAGDYRIEAFTNPSGADASGNGEGETFEVGTTITHTGSGSESFQVVYAGAVGDSVALTATEDLGGGSYGSTSEFSAGASVAGTPTVTVNSTADDGDASPGDHVCDTGGTNSEGDTECTLRAAIQEANTSAIVDTIAFAIPTSDPGYSASPLSYTITPGSFLGFITDPVTLDATTQPGFVTDPIIELDGSSATGATAGLSLRTNDSEIRGFIVHSFDDDGLEIDGQTGFGDNNVLAGNWTGIDASGAAAPNLDAGVVIAAGSGNVVGGTNPGDENVIAGNTTAGVHIREASAIDNTVIGNAIGVLADGTTARPNGTHGIRIHVGATDNQIGGLVADEGNMIAHNGLDGIHVESDAGADNAILGNAIHSNGQLGIDLGGGAGEDAFGVTPNDGGDADSGPNDVLNRPVITAATVAAGTVTVDFDLDVAAGNYRIEFFVNPGGADISGSGEGESFVSPEIVLTHPGGAASYSTTFPGAIGDIVTATTTEGSIAPFGATSEFSVAATAVAANTPPTADAGGPYTIAEGDDLDLDASATTDPDPDTLTYTWDLDNDGSYDDATTDTPTITWAALVGLGFDDDGGPYPVAVQVDDGTATATASTTLTITNAAPTITVSGVGTIIAGASYTVNLGVTDPGADTVTSWIVNWGDGTIDTIAGNPSTASHTYDSVRSYNVTASVLDEDGTFSSGDVLVAMNTGGAVAGFDGNSGDLLRTFADAALGNPIGVAVGPDGQMYASGLAANTVVRFDLSTGLVIDTFVTAGSGGLASPTGLTFAANGDLLVASLGTNSIKRYAAADGAYIGEFVAAGGDGVTAPLDMTHDRAGDLYVSSWTTGEIRRYDPTGAYVETFVASGLTQTTGLAFGDNGNLYAADFAGLTPGIHEFDGATGAAVGQVLSLASPSSVRFGPDGNLYVASSTLDVVNVYDATGTFIRTHSDAADAVASPYLIDFEPAHQVAVTAIEVNATTDGSDLTPGDGVCDTGITNSEGDAACSLRAAIQEANALDAGSSIEFTIPDTEAGYQALGAGLSYWSIEPTAVLPTLTVAGVAIDGSSQTTFATAQGFDVNDAGPEIELVGTTAGGNGLDITGGGATVRGLAINRFVTGIRLEGGGANRVVGNYLGPDASGQNGLVGNVTQGILITESADNVIGGPSPADRNVISGNRLRGIAIDDWSDGALLASTGTRIVGNYIGTTADGSAALPYAAATYQQIGIYALDTGDAVIGEAGAGNVISGNDWYGIYVWNANGTPHTIQANTIGLDAARSAPVGNGADDPVNRGGIFLSNAAGNLIGGTGVGEGNVIAGNDGKGVIVFGTAGLANSILGNGFHDNGGVGIDLDTDGVTPNDAGDGDTGPNDLLNFPVITTVQRVAGELVVDLELDVPAGDYRLELFGNTSAHASGHGEGETVLGGETVTHTGSGVETFQVAVTSAATIVTATATEDLGGGTYGATSEFSAAVPSPDLVIVNSTGDGADGASGDGQCDTGGTNALGNPECTLRAAIEEANDPTTPIDTIWFAIPVADDGHTAGLWTIAPATALPSITAPVALDASTQPGYLANTAAAPQPLDNLPVVELDGANLGNGVHLTAGAPGSIVRGLTIGGFGGAGNHGIEIEANDVTVTGTVVGLDADGVADNPNGSGIAVDADRTVIGGASPADRNVVAGSQSGQIRLDGGSDTQILGNIIGADAATSTLPGTAGTGIQAWTGDNVTIGSALAPNVIGAAGGDWGIEGGATNLTIDSNLLGTDVTYAADLGDGNAIWAGGAGPTTIVGNVVANWDSGITIADTGAVVTGNAIGTDPGATLDLGNSADGIVAAGGAADTTIGGTTPGDANTIAFNGAAGVRIAAATTDPSIRGNQIFANGGLGIDHDGDGPSANDAGDVDGLPNAPVLIAAINDGGVTDVDLTLDVAAGSYLLDVYENPDGADPSGFGEGRTLVASFDLAHPGGGSATFRYPVPGAAGAVLTATVTASPSPSATSEFSNALAATSRALATVHDVGGRRSDVTRVGGATADQLGLVGRAIDLPGGTGRLTGPALDITSPALTLGAWVEFDALSGNHAVLSKLDSSGNAIYELGVDGGTGEAVAALRLSGATVQARGGVVSTASWHHLSATWDGAEVVLFVDGTEVDRVAAVGILATDPQTPLMIGGRADGNRGVDGRVDQVVVRHDQAPGAEVLAGHRLATDPSTYVTVGAEQTSTPAPWTVSGSTSRTGGFALEAPTTSGPDAAAWVVASAIDEPGLVFESWWWVSTNSGLDVSAGTRAGLTPTDQYEAALTSPSGWELRRRDGATESVVAPAAGTPQVGTWVKVEMWTNQLGDSRIVVDGVEVTGWTSQGSTLTSGSAGLRTGLLPGVEDWFIDDTRARKLITPEPLTSLSSVDRN